MINSEQIICNMSLHERCTVRSDGGNTLCVTHVMSGWIYEYLCVWDDKIIQYYGPSWPRAPR